MELVSIVVPVYNMGDKIKKCVSALLSQTYMNLEIILVDDGSKDDSYERCVELSREDARVIVIHTENQGSGPARNEGIAVAQGKYIYFPDADDYLEPEAIEIVEKRARETGADIVVFGYKCVGTSGKLLSEKKYPCLTVPAKEIRMNYSEYYSESGARTVQGAPWNKFFDIEVIKKYGLTYPSLRRHQDEGFIARYVDKSSKITFMEEILYTYYVNDLKRQWDKYPVGYIDSVEGLFKERQANILIWDASDKKTHDLAYNEYICNFIKALELSFSPKFRFTMRERIQWIKDRAENYCFSSICVPKCTALYQRTVKFLIEHKAWGITYLILRLKVIVEIMIR